VGAIPFITAGVDTESAFLTSAHIASISSLDIDASELLICRAISEVREESVAKLSNERTQHAASLKRKGENVSTSAYAHVKKAEEDFDIDPRRYCLGKKAVKRLKQLYHEQTGESLNPIISSPALGSELFLHLRREP
jgi:hypothetical protein